MFCEEFLELFQKIHVALPKPVGYINKQKMLLTYICGKWSMDKINKTSSDEKTKIEQGGKEEEIRYQAKYLKIS